VRSASSTTGQTLVRTSAVRLRRLLGPAGDVRGGGSEQSFELTSKLLERAPHWSEEQAERALRAAEGDVDEWRNLRAQTQELAEQAERRLREREHAAGESW
jgi:hypothetical protein